MRGVGGEFRGLSKRVKMYTRAQINFGYLTLFLTYGKDHRVGRGVGRAQFRRGDIHCGTLYVHVLCGKDSPNPQNDVKIRLKYICMTHVQRIAMIQLQNANRLLNYFTYNIGWKLQVSK
jgi:hypothetical protein